MNNTCPQPKKVHLVLASSHLVLFLSFIVGFATDALFQNQGLPVWSPVVGVIFLGLGTIVIFLAQSTSARTSSVRKSDDLSADTFKVGLYRYLNSPTHLGVVLLLLSYAFIVGSPYFIMAILSGAIISYGVFIPREQKLLEEKYGSAYRDYKNSLKTFF